MSVHMKKPLIRIIIGEEIFDIPSKDAKAVHSVVKIAERAHKREYVQSENVFRDIFDNLPRGAINLKASRVKENMSQKELSEKSGIPLTLISKYENGHRIISEDLAKKLAKIFKTNHKIYLEKKVSKLSINLKSL